jgi:hypothetical protein
MEEKLIAPEWTMQRLASEISKVELCLSQKEREAASLQKHQFSDLINQQGEPLSGEGGNSPLSH